MLKYIQAIRVGVIAVLLCSGIISQAQTITASVNGTVTDPSGAVVANAKVIATNVDTGVGTPTTTNKDGIYVINFLQIGQYKVSVEAAGFAAATYGPFTLETGQNAKIDSKLSVERSAQQVAVEAEVAPLLNTENSTLATTLDTRAIDSIPLIGRDIVQLTIFLPGAVSTSPSGFAGNSAIGHGGNTVSVNGNRQQSNNYLLDGIDINETLNNTPGYNPGPDSIGQYQIISANASAEYGNVNGGDILAQTKAGTNQWHGSAYYYITNYNLNANSWSNKHTTTITPRASFTQIQPGGTVGGPILHDKLFIFGSYDGGRYHQGGAGNTTVATVKQRNGDFSELYNPALLCSQTGGACSSNAKLFQLYNGTATTIAGVPTFGAFPNNQIPVVNPVWKYLFAHPNLYPLPNQAPSATNSPASNNYRAATKNRQYNDQFTVRGDYKASSKDNLSIRYISSNNGSTSTPALAITFPTAPLNPVRGVAINEVHTLNASMVNEFRAGYTRIQSLGAVTLDTTGVFGTTGNSVFGIPGPQAFAGFSAISEGGPPSPSGISSSGNGTEYSIVGNSNTGTNFTDNTFVYGDNFTWLKGKHTLKFGVTFQRQQQNNFYPGNDGSVGGFYYLGAATSTPNADPNGYAHNGYNFADSILDQASFASKGGVSGPAGFRSWRDAYFVQDDFKFRPNLTLNIGVRYDYVQPLYEVHNRQSTVDPANPSVIITAGTPSTTGLPPGTTVVSAATAGYSRALIDAYYGGVEPRVGFSYSLTPKWVWRGGYGIQNYMEGTGANLRQTTNLPYQSTYEGSGRPQSSTVGASLFQVETGFGGSSAAAATGGVFNIWDRHIKPAFIGEYSLTTEYQVSNTASFQIGYVGESGQHLITANQGNQLRQACVINGVPVSGATSTPSAACLAQSPAPFYLTPTVGYNGTIRETASNAAYNYNALQATFRQRAWHGLQYTLNYTYSHAFTNSTGFYGVPSISAASAYAENFYNNHAEYGPVGQDVRNNLNWNLVYDLPIGRGRQFGANMPFILDEIVGGWKVAMTGIEYSGFPVNLVANNNTDVNGAGTQRPNHYRRLKITGRSLNNWFGTDPSATECTTPGVDNGVCAYGQPANGTFGNSAVGTERTPGFQQYDASVRKDFTVWHEQKIGFGTDASNVFNQSELSNPNNNVTSTTFGQITNVRSGVRRLQLWAKYTF